jgi:C4-dicarboxylate-specific signal transduction histidine kinase
MTSNEINNLIVTNLLTAVVCLGASLFVDSYKSGRRWLKQFNEKEEMRQKHRAEMDELRAEHRAERQAEHEKKMAEIQKRADANERRREIDEALRPIIRRIDKISPLTATEAITELQALTEREN